MPPVLTLILVTPLRGVTHPLALRATCYADRPCVDTQESVVVTQLCQEEGVFLDLVDETVLVVDAS
ncbi:hypothetical protein BDD21_3135 [Thiocapsa rosea]|uniref:Uncharacterized protein n=1 Tax=Thiocapsa rosea TaxID=69360 RepID=A0A495VAK5_9GAMM|nr:hypothetical protein BDD21_3135 [Thiocapsa rosea]